MTILIDAPRWWAYERRWSHLVSDTSTDELHAFAASLGVPRRGFEGDHYDLPEEYFDAALAHGARLVSSRELMQRLRTSGLRMRKRNGDKGIARVHGVRPPGWEATDVDLILSRREVVASSVFAAVVFVRDADGSFALVSSIERRAWGAPGGWREPGESPRETAVREAAEETALVLDADALAPVGFQRFHRDDGAPNVLQVYEVQLIEHRPPLCIVADDVDGRRWVDLDGFRELCGREFWWPMIEWLYDPAGPLKGRAGRER